MNKRISILLACLFVLCFPALAQYKSSPLRGEGVDEFLIRNNRSPRKYRNVFYDLNKSRLGKNKSLLHGVKYIVPPLESSVTSSVAEASSQKSDSFYEPLFGKSLASGKVTSQRLAGACIYVVSGHGGPDPGAIGKCGGHELHEDEYAYDIVLRLARCLMAEGAEVRIIIQDKKDGIRDGAYLANSKRETCMGDPIPLGQLERLQQRCEKINSFYRKDRKKYTYCRSIFVHLDSRSKRKQTDVFFYHTIGSPRSKQLADNMKTTFGLKYDKHQPDRGFNGTVSGRNLYVLKHSTPVAVFVELGNIQNAFDQRRFVMSSNRQALAKWITDGFIRDFNQQTKR